VDEPNMFVESNDVPGPFIGGGGGDNRDVGDIGEEGREDSDGGEGEESGEDEECEDSGRSTVDRSNIGSDDDDHDHDHDVNSNMARSDNVTYPPKSD
jgi:hypothetical protein